MVTVGETRKVLTLCIIQYASGVLLGYKKHGFGVGKWNGFGGKVEPGETIVAAALREVREEAGITVTDMDKVGQIDFIFDNNPEILEGHIFRAQQFEGTPHETDEMRPQWFPLDNIPYDQMWVDDRYWLPLLLEGKKFRATFYFKDEQTLRSYEVVEVT
jgi:8-oxo-dGTP diphosphatase/2-hydroxy-dATP diphosphatase